MSLKAKLAAAALATTLGAALLPAAHAQTLRWAAQNDILTLDPHSQNHATTSAILQHTYEGLTRYSKTYGVEPCLATAWQPLGIFSLVVTLMTSLLLASVTGLLGARFKKVLLRDINAKKKKTNN